jgi:hypothetical protein
MYRFASPMHMPIDLRKITTGGRDVSRKLPGIHHSKKIYDLQRGLPINDAFSVCLSIAKGI